MFPKPQWNGSQRLKEWELVFYKHGINDLLSLSMHTIIKTSKHEF